MRYDSWCFSFSSQAFDPGFRYALSSDVVLDFLLGCCSSAGHYKPLSVIGHFLDVPS